LLDSCENFTVTAAGGASPSPTGFQKRFLIWVGEALGPPVRIRTRSDGSAKPGAGGKPQQRQFLQTQGPVARNKLRRPLRFCAPGMLCPPQGVPPVMGVLGDGRHGGGRLCRTADCARPLAVLKVNCP